METNNSLMRALIEQQGVANVENDVPAVRHNREEEVVFVWSRLMLVLLAILYQVWSA